MLLILERHLNYWQHLQFNVRLPTLITIVETIKFWLMNLHLQMFVYFVFVFVYIVRIYLFITFTKLWKWCIIHSDHKTPPSDNLHASWTQWIGQATNGKNIFEPQIWWSSWPLAKLHGRFAFSHNSGHLLSPGNKTFFSEDASFSYFESIWWIHDCVYALMMQFVPPWRRKLSNKSVPKHLDEDWNRILLHFVNTHKRTIKSLLIIFLENNFIGIGWVRPLYY